MMVRSWPILPQWLEASTQSQEFLDEYTLVHGFVGWKMGQLWGFWPSVLAHVIYEGVVDPLRHAPHERAAPINTAGDLLVGIAAAYFGSRYRQ